MSYITIHTCDGCSLDISDYLADKPTQRLELSARYVMPKNSSGPLSVKEPLLEREKHFCSFRCLGNWMEENEKL